jgi:hypothetical protein
MKTRRYMLALVCLATIVVGAGMTGCSNNTMSATDIEKMKEKPGAMPSGAMNDIAKMQAEYAKRHPNQAQAPPPGVPGATAPPPSGKQ